MDTDKLYLIPIDSEFFTFEGKTLLDIFKENHMDIFKAYINNKDILRFKGLPENLICGANMMNGNLKELHTGKEIECLSLDELMKHEIDLIKLSKYMLGYFTYSDELSKFFMEPTKVMARHYEIYEEKTSEAKIISFEEHKTRKRSK